MGLTPPDWLAYGALPITIILALHYTPFVILLFGSALRRSTRSWRIPPAFSVPARSRWRADHPAADAPSLLSAATLIFAKCLGDFGVPYVLGVPVKFDVLSTSLFRAIASRQTGVAAVLAGVIMLHRHLLHR
jgi:iron(III) transport system permease protein